MAAGRNALAERIAIRVREHACCAGGCGQRDVDNGIASTDISDCAADALRASQQESRS